MYDRLDTCPVQVAIEEHLFNLQFLHHGSACWSCPVVCRPRPVDNLEERGINLKIAMLSDFSECGSVFAFGMGGIDLSSNESNLSAAGHYERISLDHM